VINCSITSEYKFGYCNEGYDLDLQVGKTAIENGCHYIMMNTRKVYGQSSILRTYDELSPINPCDHYSENKSKTEFKLLNMSDNCTILRASNVFGFEPMRKSFMGWCIDQLKTTNRIVYDINPNVKRDFIDIDTFNSTLKLICEQKPKGVFNIGSNEGTNIGNISKWLIAGYGRGELIIRNDILKDQFILNTTKLCSRLNMKIGPVYHEKIIKNIGEKLNEK
jgi:nucleoside-diphosphate-sugar epimerase